MDGGMSNNGGRERPAAAEDDRRAWERPGPQQVGPDVFRIPLPLPGDSLRAVNVYAMRDGPRGLLLVDGGWAVPAATEELRRALATLGHHPRDIRRILVTHMHRDHYTLAIWLRREYGTSVSIGEGEEGGLESVADYHDDLLPQPMVDRIRWHGGGPELDEIADASADVMEPIDSSVWEKPDGWLRDGDRLTLADRTIEVLGTPGHTNGHLVFRDAAAGLLFTGDHVLPHITPSVGFEAFWRPSALTDYLASLQALLELPDHTLLPAHGPVTDSVHRRVHEILEHHRVRLDQTAAAVQAGAGSAAEVARRLRWTRRQRAFAALTPFDRVLAINETGAHLDALVLRGELTRHESESACRYVIA
jgi:glyoxylase-like metal-dependent hydrolase (beta-lactamase superfamily II)